MSVASSKRSSFIVAIGANPASSPHGTGQHSCALEVKRKHPHPIAFRSRFDAIIDVPLDSGLTEAEATQAVIKVLDIGFKQNQRMAEISARENTRRHAKAERDHQAWQDAALPIWRRHPQFSAMAVAASVIQQLGLKRNVKTVAKAIGGLNPKVERAR